MKSFSPRDDFLSKPLHTACELMRIAWVTVGEIVQRVVERKGPDDLRDGLTQIGVDELSYRRHHKYLTVVTDHISGRVVWIREGKNAETLADFFAQLGAKRCAKIQVVTMDMSAAYEKAVTEACPHAQIIWDRFHVQRLVHDALDQVRRAEVRTVDEPSDKKALKKTRWALQKNPWNLSQAEYDKLSALPRANRRLYRAYLLKEALCDVLDRHQVHVATRKMQEWLGWAARSRLAPFVKVARTIRARLDGILAYVRSGLSNGPSEGLNGKIRTLTRRSYGFHTATNLIALISLCCTGLHLEPVRVYPTSR
jgi:transposase